MMYKVIGKMLKLLTKQNLCILLTWIYYTEGTLFVYHGCYLYFRSSVRYTNETNMSGRICMDFCLTKNYSWSAISLGSICNCNNEQAYIKVNTSQCNYKCPGNEQESCGGDGIFTSTMWGVTERKDESNERTDEIGGIKGWKVIVLAFSALLVLVIAAVCLAFYIWKRRAINRGSSVIKPGDYIDDRVSKNMTKEIN